MLKIGYIMPIILLASLAFVFVLAADASLSPMSFGFPALTQSTSNTAFNNATQTAFDFEQANFSPFGSTGFGFPTLSQNSVQGQSLAQVDFSQNTVFSAYSYPSVDFGTGFAGFNIAGFGDLL